MFKHFGKAIVILQLCTNIATSMDSLKIEEGIGYNHNNIQNKYNNTQNNSIDKVFKIEYMNSTDSKNLNNHRTSVPTIIAKDEQEMKTLYTLIKKFKDREERIVECEFVMRYEISLYSMGPLDTTLENTVCNVNELYNSNMFFGKKPHEEIFSWIRSFKDFSIINNSVMNITQMKGIILLAKTADLMQRPNKKTVFTSTLCEKDMISNTHTLGFPNIFKILFKINFIKNSLNNFFSTDKQSRFGKHSKICIIPKTFHKFLDAVELCSTCKLSTTIKKDKQERTINQSVITYKDYKSLLDVLIKSFVVNLLQACDEVAGEYYDYFISPQKMKDMFCNEYNNKNLISFLGKDCVDNITYVLYKRFCTDNKKYNFINIMDHFYFFSSFLNENIKNPFINNESLYNIIDCSTCNEVKQYINKEQSRISNVFGTIFNEMKELLSRDDDEIINEFHNEWNIYHDKYTINNLLKRFKQEKKLESNLSKYLNKILVDETQQYFLNDLYNSIKQYEIALRNTDIYLKLISTRKLLNDGKDNSYIYDNVIKKPFFKILPRHLCFTIASYVPYNRLCYRLFDAKNFVILGMCNVDDKYNLLKIDENDRKKYVMPLLRKKNIKNK